MKKKKLLKSIIIISITSYLVFGVSLFIFQKSFVYHPDNQSFENCEAYKEYEKKIYNQTRFYYKKKSTTDVLVYYHGNTGSTCDRNYLAPLFENTDKTLILVEYAGFSNDIVKPSKNLILKDVENIHAFVKEKGFKNITVYGQSLGSGTGSYHTYLGNVNSLILIVPFSKLSDVAQSEYPMYPASLILTEEYDNIKWLENYTGRLLIIHGDNDKVISHTLSQKLFESISSEQKEYLLIKGIGHDEVSRGSVFEEKVKEFFNTSYQ